MNFANKLSLAAVLTLVGSAAVMADCAYPKKPADPPNGAKATQEEMVAAMKATKQFDADVKAYQSCLDQERDNMVKALGDKATPEDIKRINDRQNQKANVAYEDATKVADEFNVQLRAYKSK
jgi:hypothetical protein